MKFAADELSKNARGGTELIKNRLKAEFENEPGLENIQFFTSRVHEPIDPNAIVIYHHQDLPNDTSAVEQLKDGRWRRFDWLVFNSNWQMNAFMGCFGIPYDRCVVLDNAIDPIPAHEKPNGVTRLCYYSTPHRGLELLYPAFEALANKHPDIVLEVASSFATYGWVERDTHYQKLFDQLQAHPRITYHGSLTNEGIRDMIQRSHIFAYPSIWMETSCISLIEAMSGGLFCVHPNLAALADTSGGLTTMYQYNEDHNTHATTFMNVLDQAITSVHEKNAVDYLNFQKIYADVRFSWEKRIPQWRNFLHAAVQIGSRKIDPSTSSVFTYKSS